MLNEEATKDCVSVSTSPLTSKGTCQCICPPVSTGGYSVAGASVVEYPGGYSVAEASSVPCPGARERRAASACRGFRCRPPWFVTGLTKCQTPCELGFLLYLHHRFRNGEEIIVDAGTDAEEHDARRGERAALLGCF